MTPAASVRFDVLTIFPGMFDGPMSESILGRAAAAGLIEVHLHDLRNWAHDRHRTVDDYPFGGGAGMVMKPEPIVEAIEAIRPLAEPQPFVVYLSPQGQPLDRALVDRLAEHPRLLLLCGRYEGVDERVLEHVVDLEVSVGDFVVSGGELPAMMLIDAVARRVPGVLGSEGSLEEESFEGGLLEYPQYTRPAVFRDWPVPDVLLSGHHGEIEAWRRRERLLRTRARRPDLIARADLTPRERAWLAEGREDADAGFAVAHVGATTFEVAVAAVIATGGRVLLHRPPGGTWTLPGGRLRVGEPLAEAARRAVAASTGLRVAAGEPLWTLDRLSEGDGGLSHRLTVAVEAAVPAPLVEREAFDADDLRGDVPPGEFRWIAPDGLAGAGLDEAESARLVAYLEARR